jgi:hypothetical protein
VKNAFGIMRKPRARKEPVSDPPPIWEEVWKKYTKDRRDTIGRYD